MTNRDHYQAEGLSEVIHFSRSHVFAAVFLIVIMALVLLGLWLTPKSHDVEVNQDTVIPWSPHPPREPERLDR